MNNVQSTSSKIKAFIADKKADELSINTIRSYEQKLKPFVEFCGEDFDDIDKNLLDMFFHHYGQTHQSSSTNAIFVTVKIFYNWIEYHYPDDIVYKNPMSKLKAPRKKPIIHDPLDLEDFKKMISYCNTHKNGVFYQALFYFLLQTGTRAAECLSCDIDDVDLRTGQVTIRHGKGDKERTVFIASQGKKSLKAYLKTRTDNDPALWFSSYEKRLSYSGLNRILKTVAEGAKIPPPSAHDFRRAFCKNMILDKTNVNPYIVQILMGWTSNVQMRKYVKLYTTDIGTAYAQSGIDDWLKGNR
jgi:integrase/recombinase XerD